MKLRDFINQCKVVRPQDWDECELVIKAVVRGTDSSSSWPVERQDITFENELTIQITQQIDILLD